MTPEMIAQAIAAKYLMHYPEAHSLTTEDLTNSVRNYVLSSYTHAQGGVNASRSFGKQPRQREMDTAELLSRYLHDVSPIVHFIRPQDRQEQPDVNDPASMSFHEYSTYRSSASQYGSRVSTYHTGRGLFDI